MIERLKIENLGPIKQADVDFKNLTIICGKNSVGKTYLSYTYYLLSKQLQTAISSCITLPEELLFSVKEMARANSISRKQLNLTIDSLGITKEAIYSLLKKPSVQQDIYEELGLDFNESSSVMADFGDWFDNKTLNSRSEINLESDLSVNIKKKSGSQEFSITLEISSIEEASEDILINDVLFIIKVFLIDYIFKLRQFPITSERTGISLFYPELDQKLRGNLIEDNKKESIRYCDPIENNISSIRQIRNAGRSYNNLDFQYNTRKNIHDQIADLLGGEYVTENKQLFFKPKNKDIRVPLRSSSGASKSLLLVDYFVKSISRFGALIIDEPELNLHVDSQKKIARLLCSIANQGVQVVVTTHSDHFVREVNNLIMLSSPKVKSETKQKILSESGIDSSSIISPNSVSTVVINSTTNKTQKMDVSEYGIDLKLFNDEIMKGNDISNELMMSIYSGE
ncbi:hypothetical protein VCR15J2_360047 [Vibrio coralliirubri]|uniref:AAA family ATPase n=1 Tax=Vibrio coralliirubri TaxID=1516159 RepID=UPI000632FED8|nr:AAA family ATPase [Vibrio coralliirubri]CDT52032.1 hypothetical protein VCR15J2_360047 [Vibrio coralliirubri]